MTGSAAEPGAAQEYRPLLFSIAYGMTGSVGDAEDLVQDAYLGMARAVRAGSRRPQSFALLNRRPWSRPIGGKCRTPG